MPGFISAENAIRETTDKKKALQIMEEIDMSILPIVNENRQFIGIVDRSKLTAGILMEIARRLESGD